MREWINRHVRLVLYTLALIIIGGVSAILMVIPNSTPEQDDYTQYMESLEAQE